MDQISNGITTLVNGFGQMLNTATDPLTVAFAVIAATFAWLARIEIDEYDRQGTKPEVGRH